MSASSPRSLRFWLTATFVALAVVPTIVVGVAAVRAAVGQVREQVTSRNEQVAIAISGEVGGFLAAQLVHLQEVHDAVESAPRLRVDVDELLGLHLRSNHAVTTLVVLDRGGFAVHVAPFDADLHGMDLSAHPAVRAAWASRAPTWSSATISLRTGEPVVELVVPGPDLTVVAYLDLDALEAIVERTRPAAGGEVAVIDRDGTLIAHPETRLVRQQVNLKDLALVRDALGGRHGTAEYRLLDRAWLGSATAVPVTGWAVLVAEPLERAYRRVNDLQDVLVLVLVGAVLAAGLLGVAGARWVVRPIAALSASTREIAAGAYDRALPREEARRYREIDELAASFAAMAAAVRSREDELARSERHYRTIVDTPAVGVVRTTLSGEILFANEAFARMVGVGQPEQLAGRNIGVFHADGLDRAHVLEQVLTAGRAPNVEVRFRSAAGAESHVLLNVARDGEALTTVALDVSDLKRAAADRTRLEQELFHAQKLEAIGRLAGGVAHDFNNLLAAIVGFASSLDEGLRENRPEREDVQGILECAQRASRLTQSLLAYGRKQVLAPRPIELGEVLRGVEKLVRRLAGASVELVFDVPERGLAVVADPGQLEQVLVNLCTNARDAMRGAGCLRVAADALDVPAEDVARLGIARRGRYVRVRVSDSGEGMSAEIAARVFEPFFTTKPAGKGTGLGLAIVHGIVQQHGGAVLVESAPGAGTTVTVLFPAAATSAPQREPRAQASGREPLAARS
jgi:PAS domain S-box-containing protein